MPTRTILNLLAGLAIVGLVACGAPDGQRQASPSAQVETLIAQVLPDELQADRVEVVQVTYPPGAPGTPPHRHSGVVFAYVAQGAIVSQLEGGASQTYSEGEMFYEPPGTLHLVSRNASTSESATLVAFFVRPDDGQPSTVPETP